MPETPNYKDFCREVYLQTYESTYPIELRDGVSAAAQQAARLSAQRKAIDRALVEGLLHFSPEVSEREIWEAIGITHKINVANLSDFNIAEQDQEPVINKSIDDSLNLFVAHAISAARQFISDRRMLNHEWNA